MLSRVVIATITGVACAVSFGTGACSHRDPLNDLPADAAAVSFTSGDAAQEPDAGLLEYCPATSCPFPFTTCPTSRYLCDVNLESDRSNCGACGFSCPWRNQAVFECLSGVCQLTACDPGFADCNGVIDDDCEVKFGSNENCNGCGDRCPDPAKPCFWDDTQKKGQCGCDLGLTLCGTSCVPLDSDDNNCQACGVTCDPSGGGQPPRDHAYYGCSGGTCGHLKCNDGYGDCDDDVTNGCETYLLDPKTCGTCKKACDPGQTCRKNRQGKGECICPPGQTLCGQACVDIVSDPWNCGGCGIMCTAVAVNLNGVALCAAGSCDYNCAQGWGDCNADLADGCEVNLLSNPNHCGACGNACLEDQPCIAGKCAVEPCGGGAGAR